MIATLEVPTKNGQSTTAVVKNITPDEAQRMLECKSSTGIMNRPVSKALVKRYVAEMKRGEWVLQYEPIIVSTSGFVLDGQHRLHAVAESGTTQPFLVVSNAAEALISKIGTGGRRSPADVLAMHGYTNTNSIAAIVRIINSYKHSGIVKVNTMVDPEPHEYPVLIERYPGVIQASTYARAHIKSGLLTVSLLGSLWYILGEISSESRNEFFKKLMSGADIEMGSPIHVLRIRLEQLAIARRSKAAVERENMTAIAAMVIKAWNAFRENQEIKILRFKRNESFPVAV